MEHNISEASKKHSIMFVRQTCTFTFFLAFVLQAVTGFSQSHKPYVPTQYPDRLILGWQDNPATTQSVNWRTDSTVTRAVGAIAEADPSPDVVTKAIEVPGLVFHGLGGGQHAEVFLLFHEFTLRICTYKGIIIMQNDTWNS